MSFCLFSYFIFWGVEQHVKVNGFTLFHQITVADCTNLFWHVFFKNKKMHFLLILSSTCVSADADSCALPPCIPLSVTKLRSVTSVWHEVMQKIGECCCQCSLPELPRCVALCEICMCNKTYLNISCCTYISKVYTQTWVYLCTDMVLQKVVFERNAQRCVPFTEALWQLISS